MQFELFHDQGGGFISNIEPKKEDCVSVRLRVTKDAVTDVVIQYSEEGSHWQEIEMAKRETDQTGYYEFWEGTIPAMGNRYYYRFYAAGQKGRAYFGAEGMSESAPVCRDCFVLVPGLKTPDWAKGILWYSIMPDAFCNGDILNDITESGLKKTVPWNAKRRGLYEYHGGDIRGIISKLDYVKELGAEGVYVNPMWTSESNAGYGPNNYYEISPNYGNEEDFIELSRKVHEKEMRLMIDAVFSYSQPNSIFTNKNGHQPLLGAFESQDSAYREMFQFEKWPTEYIHKWGGIENDLGSETARDLLWRREDSVLQRYLREPYDADGWRFDAIASYAGTDTNLDRIGAEIRAYTKAAKPDVLLTGEDYGVREVMSGNWDSMQNSFFLFSAKLWFQMGQYNQSWLAERLAMLAKLPRTVGLCLYNNYDLHDVKRLITDYEKERYRIKAVWLLQMTFVGAPVVYYKDEVGADAHASNWESFDWNTGEWNQELLALCKTLGRLRKEYTALKDGAFKVGVIDDERQLTVFGRWDEKDSVVTMLNQREETQEITLDLKQYNIADGSVVTDYLTGETYVVEKGCAHVRIPAGGSILVTGKAGTYRDIFKLTKEASRSHVVVPKEHTYILQGCCQETEMMTPVYGCGYIEADIRRELEGGALYLRDGEKGKQVAVQFVKDSIIVTDTENGNVWQGAMPEGGRIRLGMLPEGCVAVFIDGTRVEESICPLTRTEKIYVGMTSDGSRTIFSGVKAENGSAALYDDFSRPYLQNLLSVSEMKGTYETADGRLHLKAEEFSLLLTEEHSFDFTFKAELTGVTDGFAGITSYCDAQNGVALVRDVTQEDCLIFGYLRNGAVIPCEIITGDFTGGVVLKLQRVGNVYTAVYVKNGRTQGFSTPIMANLSVARAGLLCSERSEAEFSYACFGDSIQDGHTINTPVTLCQGNHWLAASEEGLRSRKLEQYEIIGDQSEWEYALGGIRRNHTEGLSQLAIANKTYHNFKIQCTLLRLGGDGTMGVTMLRSSMDKTIGDGYRLVLAADGILSLVRGEEELISRRLQEVSPYGLKLNIIRQEQNLYVYIGEDNELFACISDVAEQSGFVSFYMDNICGHINNYMVCDYLTPWLEPVSPWTQNVKSDGNGLIVQNDGLVMANRKGAAYTDVQVSARVILHPEDKEKDAYAGFLFGTSQDVEPELGGVLVALNQKGTLYLSKEGEVKQSVSLHTEIPSVYLSVVVRAGLYQVYLYDEKEPILTWQDAEYNGGVVSLVSEHSRTAFYQLEIRDLTEQEVVFPEEKYLICRNGKQIACADTYTEEAVGRITYQIEPRKEDRKAYVLEMDLTVCHPESDDTYPTVYFRKDATQKIGLYCGGSYTGLVNANGGEISDEAAETTWLFAGRRAEETYHITIETEPDNVSVKVNDAYFYKNIRLSTCLSGDFSNLSFVPEIVCNQGKSGSTKTIIKNITIREK